MKKKIYLLLASIALLTGCRVSQPSIATYYLIEIPKGVELKNPLSPLSYALEVATVTINPAYATHQIALREDTHRIRYFTQHQWATRPELSITNLIAHYLRTLEVFRRIETRYWGEIPDYRIITTVHHIQIVEQGKRFEASLSVAFSLVRAKGEEAAVASHSATVTRILPKRNVNLFADAISYLLVEELNVFTQKVQAAVTATKPTYLE